MFTTILLVLLLLGGTITLAVGVVGRRVGLAATGFGIGFVGFLIAVFSMVTIVSATEVGVPVSFGKVGSPLTAGLHVVAPWTDVESLPVRPFPVEDMTIKGRTSQGGQVNATVGARWHVIPAQAGDLYLQVRTGDEDQISKTVVDKALGTAVGNVFVTEDNQTATTDRTGVERALNDEVNRLVSSYGITVDNVWLRQVEPDQTTADALARVAAQQRATIIAQEANKTAQADATRRLTEAEGLKQAASQVANLSPTQVQALCLQAWERMETAAINQGQPMYTAPCGSGSSVGVLAK